MGAIVKHSLLKVVETSGQRMYPLYWPVITQLKKGEPIFFSPRLLKHAILEQPTVDNGAVKRERSVGCWLLAHQGTLMTL